MLLKARWVLPMDGPPIEDGAILVRDDRIAEVGSASAIVLPEGDEQRDFEQAALMPGFVDLHTHLQYSAFRGLCDDLPYTWWKIQVGELAQRLDDDDWRASADLGVLEALQSGITCVADISDASFALDAVLAAGLRGVLYREVSGMGHRVADAKLAEAEEEIVKARAKAEGRPVTIGVAPHSPYAASSEIYAGCAALADRLDLPIATHLAGSKDEYDFVKHGSSPLAYEYREQRGWQDIPWQPMGVSPVKYVQQWEVLHCDNVMVAHAIHASDEDVAILARYDVAVAHCPRCAAKLGMGVAPLRRYLTHGLRLGLGTDSPASSSIMDFFDEMRIGLLMQRAATQSVGEFSAARFVRMATTGGAAALKLDREIGTLAPGMAADIIAVDLSHAHQLPGGDPYSTLVYTANQEDVLMTMVGGRILFERGAFTGLDAGAVVSAAEAVRSKLRG